MATEEEVTISELEFEQNLSDDMILPVEGTTNTKSTSLGVIRNWLKNTFQLIGSYVTTNTDQFIDSMKVMRGKNLEFREQNLDLDAVSSDTWGNSSMEFKDKDAQRLGFINVFARPSGEIYLRFYGGNYGIGVSSLGYAIAPQTPSNATQNEIITSNWDNLPKLRAVNNFTAHQNITTGNNDKIKIKDTRVDITSQTGTNTFNNIIFLDKNSLTAGNVAYIDQTDGTRKISIMAYNRASGENKEGQISVGVKADGRVYTECPASSLVNSIVTTSSLGNQSVKFGNGITIQWGQGNYRNGDLIDFDIPFSTTSYSAIATDTSTGVSIATGKVTTTNFEIKMSSSPRNIKWIAIGK